MKARDRRIALDFLGQLQRKALAHEVDRPPTMQELRQRIAKMNVHEGLAHLYRSDAYREGIRRMVLGCADPTPVPQPFHYELLSRWSGLLSSKIRSNDKRIRFQTPMIGVLPNASLSPQHIRVPTTSVHLVVVSKEFFPFCDLFAKCLSVLLAPAEEGEGIAFNTRAEHVIDGSERQERALAMLHFHLLAFSMFGRWEFAPNPIMSTLQQDLRNRFMPGMEIFGVAHEYGHVLMDAHVDHAAASEAEGRAGAWEEELEADRIGQALHLAVAKMPDVLFFTGPSLLLTALDLVDRIRWTLEHGDAPRPPSASHPGLRERLENLKATLPPVPENLPLAIHSCRANLCGLLERVWDRMLPGLLEMHAFGMRPMVHEFDPAAGAL